MSQPPENPRPSLRPPQFGLRTLLALMAGCAALLELSRFGVPPVVIVGLGFLALSVFCHVAGNALGTRLRDIGDIPESAALTAQKRRRPEPHEFAPTTRLGQRQTLGWSIVIASSMGLASGAIGGGLWTFLACRGPIEPMNIAVGMIAFGVLGGIAAFATVGFTQVLLGAVWQAMKNVPSEAPANEGDESARLCGPISAAEERG